MSGAGTGLCLGGGVGVSGGGGGGAGSATGSLSDVSLVALVGAWGICRVLKFSLPHFVILLSFYASSPLCVRFVAFALQAHILDSLFISSSNLHISLPHFFTAFLQC